MINTLRSHIHLFKDLEEEKVKAEYTEEKTFLKLRGRIGILEYGFYI